VGINTLTGLYGGLRVFNAFNMIRSMFYHIPFAVNCLVLDHLPIIVQSLKKLGAHKKPKSSARTGNKKEAKWMEIQKIVRGSQSILSDANTVDLRNIDDSQLSSQAFSNIQTVDIEMAELATVNTSDGALLTTFKFGKFQQVVI
jgi:hypothetical protein